MTFISIIIFITLSHTPKTPCDKLKAVVSKRTSRFLYAEIFSLVQWQILNHSSTYFKMWMIPSLMLRRWTVDVTLGGRLGFEGKYTTTQKKRMAQIKASASIKFKISFLNSLTLFFITVLLLDRSGSRTNRGPRRKPPAFPSWLKTLLIPVAVVLSLGGNLYYKVIYQQLIFKNLKKQVKN